MIKQTKEMLKEYINKELIFHYDIIKSKEENAGQKRISRKTIMLLIQAQKELDKLPTSL